MTISEAGHRHIPPRRRRVRHFLLQLLPVTAGILIALLIDGAIELARQDALVREARAALAAEIADNAGDLESKLVTFARMQGDLDTVTKLVNDILNTGRSDIDSIGYDLQLAKLNHASWEGAQRTGALEYMEFGEVRQLAELYALQALVADMQGDVLRRLPALGIVIQAMESGDAEGYVRDLQDKRADIAEIQVALNSYLELAQQLELAYLNFACGAHPCAPAAAPPAAP